MASQFPPSDIPLVDNGHAPLIVIDGLESYIIRNDGYAFSRYYVVEPLVLPNPEFSPFRPMVRRLCLQLMCRIEAQAVMRQQVAEAMRRAMPVVAATSLMLC